MQDIVTGGQCRRDPAGLPDADCYFYATQEPVSFFASSLKFVGLVPIKGQFDESVF